ncbi:DedA family protein [Thiorhodococcus minor]|uniref:DedA family protein n=1 Tax=Thiorhodococcus minor TaxID=57489 RepID=A0A6M0K6C7_9GAMM|nr:DedA family protein [Thiorhodococcus minor]NEV63885.1 DedA family protein [Thiorhodococcus minor]
MLHEFVDWVLLTVDGWGYTGIFILMAIESSLIPFPSEVVLIPAGYLAYQGSMSLAMILVSAVLGSLLGAFLNYGFALLVGRPFLERYGKYFFVRPTLLHKTDAFFERHGAISTFTGRLIPGIRQLVSLPAGLARMRIWTFAVYTGIGAGIWSAVLIALGFFIGGNEQLIQDNLPLVTAGALAFVGITLAGYYIWQRRQPASMD